MARTPVNIRMAELGVAKVDALAADTGSDRSKVTRLILAYAMNDDKLMEQVRSRLLEEM